MIETPAGQITGDHVISELLHNVEVGLFKVRYCSRSVTVQGPLHSSAALQVQCVFCKNVIVS